MDDTSLSFAAVVRARLPPLAAPAAFAPAAAAAAAARLGVGSGVDMAEPSRAAVAAPLCCGVLCVLRDGVLTER